MCKEATVTVITNMYHVESSHLFFFLQPDEDTNRSQCSIISDRYVV